MRRFRILPYFLALSWLILSLYSSNSFSDDKKNIQQAYSNGIIKALPVLALGLNRLANPSRWEPRAQPETEETRVKTLKTALENFRNSLSEIAQTNSSNLTPEVKATLIRCVSRIQRIHSNHYNSYDNFRGELERIEQYIQEVSAQHQVQEPSRLSLAFMNTAALEALKNEQDRAILDIAKKLSDTVRILTFKTNLPEPNETLHWEGIDAAASDLHSVLTEIKFVFSKHISLPANGTTLFRHYKHYLDALSNQIEVHGLWVRDPRSIQEKIQMLSMGRPGCYRTTTPPPAPNQAPEAGANIRAPRRRPPSQD